MLDVLARRVSARALGYGSDHSMKHDHNPQEPKDGRLDRLRHFPTLLARWRGAKATMTELTLSLRTLRIVLRREGQSGHLLVACVYPFFIHGPVEWDTANITVALHGDKDFVVTDAAADVRVISASVEVKEYAAAGI
jgi:hypothetical protein